MSEQQKMDQERAALQARIAALEAGQDSLILVRDEYKRMADEYRGKWAELLARASLPVGVPDGWRIVEKSTCFALMEGNQVIATLAGPDSEENAARIAAMLAAPIVKAEQLNPGCCGTPENCPIDYSRCPHLGQPPAPSLPASGSAGSAGEEVEVVGYRHERSGAVATADNVRVMEEGSVSSGYTERLMTVAQHERIVAAISAQQASPVTNEPSPLEVIGYASPGQVAILRELPRTGGMKVKGRKDDRYSEPVVLLSDARAAMLSLAARCQQEGAFKACLECGYQDGHDEICQFHASNRKPQQSAPERVSVPVGLAARLQRFCQRPHSSRDEADALDMELRAILASHAEGGKA